jgi:hypothetical protein
MAISLLVPMSVTAKVITGTKNVAVPTLTGAPFNRDAALEPGIHVHWALPDALTSARFLNDIPDPTNPDSTNPLIFPGVPDLWLVVRFNPLPSPVPAGAKRTWQGWVVDSRATTFTALDKWQPPAVPNGSTVHTVAGLLAPAAGLGYPGWGLFDAKANASFDVAAAAYYPAARYRFGFHDPLQGLPSQGKVTYTVVGWYSNLDQDPLYNAPDRRKLLE